MNGESRELSGDLRSTFFGDNEDNKDNELYIRSVCLSLPLEVEAFKVIVDNSPITEKNCKADSHMKCNNSNVFELNECTCLEVENRSSDCFSSMESTCLQAQSRSMDCSNSTVLYSSSESINSQTREKLEISNSYSLRNSTTNNSSDSVNSTVLYSSPDASTSQSDIERNNAELSPSDSVSSSEFSFVHSSEDSFNSGSTFLYRRTSSTSDLEFNPSVDGLKCWYTNADSYLNKREEMFVEMNLQRPDVIVITELFPKPVKATDINAIEFQIDGYTLCLNKVEEKSRGVGIYFKENLSYTECTVLNSRPFKELCWCELQLKNNEKMLVGAVYRSPSSGVANNLRLNQLISLAVSLNIIIQLF